MKIHKYIPTVFYQYVHFRLTQLLLFKAILLTAQANEYIKQHPVSLSDAKKRLAIKHSEED